MKSATAFLALALLAPLAAWSQVTVALQIGPPPLPVYVQPPIPGDGYLWTPGYWGWNPADRDYYWIPGTWVLAPTPGYLWTPGYWGYYGGGYRWYAGYWGVRVGFYGGINYGYGYNGAGYYGGRWERGAFHYNTSVNNVNTTVVHNVYNTKVVNNYNSTRVSYNGGSNGVRAQPTPTQNQERRHKHFEQTPNQVEHERTAMQTPAQKASVNRGVPQVAATPRASALEAPDAIRASNKAAMAPADSPAARNKDRAAAQPGNVARSEADANAPTQKPSKQAQPGTGAGELQAAKRDQPAPMLQQPAQARSKPDQRVQVQPDDARPRPQSEQRNQGQAQAGNAQPRPDGKPQSKPQPQADGNPARAQGEPHSKDKQRE